MKKALIFILLFWATNIFVMAAGDYDEPGEYLGMPTSICTVTSEPCKLGETWWRIGGWSSQMARYQCCVSSRSWFTDFIASIYKYVFFISLVLWVLFMVVLGIGISISGFDEGKIKEKAKTQLIATLIGIVALALIPWILKTVAPFIFK